MSLRLSAVAAALPFVFSQSSVFAQITDLDVVLVTASRFQSVSLKSPIAAQVITADEIRDSSAKTLSDILSKLAGVHTRINFTGVPDSPLDLRGFGMTGDQNTLVLINGQRISEFEGATARISSIPVDSVDRIEILRGAGSVMYGGGATGGVINIITRAPVGDEIEGTLFSKFGSHDLQDIRAGLRLGSGAWGFRFNAQNFETDNYRANNRAKQDAFDAELRIGQGKDFLSFGFITDKQKARLPGARTEQLLETDRRGATTPNDYLNSDSENYTIRGEKSLGQLTFAIDLTDRKRSSELLNDQRGTWGFDTTLSKTKMNVKSVSPRMNWTSDHNSYSNNLTVGFDWSDWNYFRQAENNGFSTAPAPWGGPYGSQRFENGSQDNEALYFQNETLLASGTKLVVGARREHIKQKQQVRSLQPEVSTKHGLTSNEISVQQDLGQGYSVYGRTGRSYRVANIDENRCSAAPCTSFLKPQKSKDHEVGFEWLGKLTTFRASYFRFDIEDEIHFNRLAGPFGSNINLSPTRRDGFELQVASKKVGDFDLGATYARTRAKFRSGTYGGVNVSGNEVPLVPRERLGLNVGWQATQKTRATLNLMHVGSQHYDNDQANRFRKMPSYSVTDIRVSHLVGQWTLAIGVNNLFDKKYYSYGIVNGNYTSFNAYPEDRRNAYVSAEYRF